jgi:Ca2+-binding EF-hand superfamily protein
MMLAELENFLSNLGDEIPKEDTMKLLDELAGVEDEDGFIPYKPFVDKLCVCVCKTVCISVCV